MKKYTVLSDTESGTETHYTSENLRECVEFAEKLELDESGTIYVIDSPDFSQDRGPEIFDNIFNNCHYEREI